MGRFMKKLMSTMLVVMMVLCTNICPVKASTETGRVPITCYTIATGRVNTYTSSGAYTGYIDGATDQCKILNVYNNGWVRVQYPVSRGYKTAYTYSSNFFNNPDFSNTTIRIGAKKTVYRRANLSQSLGTVYANDDVIITGASNGNTQIIYPISGGYKMGWISGTYSTNSNEQSVNVSEGYYAIRSAVDQRFCLDVYGAYTHDGNNVTLYAYCGGDNQIFYFQKQSDGYYTIAAKHSGKLLDVEGNAMYSGSNIIQCGNNGGNNQKWVVIKNSDGTYSFKSKSNGLYLDVCGGAMECGNNIQCWEGNGTGAQKFVLEKFSGGSTVQNNTAQFQMPLANARCSWRSSSNWSWGENVNGGGYSTARVYHLGADLLGSNTNVCAVTNGTVAKSGWNSANGNYVVLKHTISNKTVYSFYAHLASRSVSAGQSVSCGQKIGVVGNTGSSSRGAHLHFAMVDTLWSGSYYGYSTYFTGNSTRYGGVTYYNPIYVVQNGRLP